MAKKRDPKLCWICDKPGVPEIGSKLQCKKCDVTWMPYGAVVTWRDDG